MDAAIKQRWVDALRSGEYKQGKHGLNFSDEEFCCLGVLCELALEDGLIEKTMEAHYGEVTGQMRYNGAPSLPPLSVIMWSGLGSPNGQYMPSDTSQPMSSLASDNDSGLTFDQLADIIEEEF